MGASESKMKRKAAAQVPQSGGSEEMAPMDAKPLQTAFARKAGVTAAKASLAKRASENRAAAADHAFVQVGDAPAPQTAQWARARGSACRAWPSAPSRRAAAAAAFCRATAALTSRDRQNRNRKQHGRAGAHTS
jgi:hypothetical protein